MDYSALEPAPGILLIAPPLMDDPNFRRTVVLLCEHDEDGSFGLVLNRPLDLQLEELTDELGSHQDLLGLGGPVQPNTLHYLHGRATLPEARHVADGVYWGGDFEAVKLLLQSETLTPAELRLFLGYAGWSPGQLADEIAAGGWLLAPARQDFVLTADPAALWRTILRRMGGEYALLANFPEDPRMN